MKPFTTSLVIAAVFVAGCDMDFETLTAHPEQVTFIAPGDELRVELVAVYPDWDEPFEPRATWSSSDSTVCGVDEEGVITAHKPGSAVVTARAGGRNAAIRVTVLAPADPRLTADPAPEIVERLAPVE